MDSNIATIIITVITGLFSIITVKIQKTENNLISKIDEQAVFFDKEKLIKQELDSAEKKRDAIIEQITIFSMKINTQIALSDATLDQATLDYIKNTSMELESSYNEVSEFILSTSREYDILKEILKSTQADIDKLKSQRKMFNG